MIRLVSTTIALLASFVTAGFGQQLASETRSQGSSIDQRCEFCNQCRDAARGDSACQCLWCREELTGDWWGKRTRLAENGIVIESSLTQFYQGVASGGVEQTSRYGDKFNLYVTGDTEKMGLWSGGQIRCHAVDWQFGQNSISDASFLAPANLAMLTPTQGPSFAMTYLMLEQKLTESGWAALVGRYNIPDLWLALYPDFGRGIEGFMNLSMVLPSPAGTTLPFVSNVAAVTKTGERGLQAMFAVVENRSSPTTAGLDFPYGVTLLGFGRINTRFRGLPGSHSFWATYGTGSYTSFDERGWIITPDGVIAPQSRGSWMAVYGFEQRCWQDASNDSRYTKIFSQVAFADESTNQFATSASLSVEAFGLCDCRPHDRMGTGLFYNELSSDFSQLASTVTSTPFSDVYGGEVYYNAAITPAFHLTTDLQVIDPGDTALDTAVVLALRANLAF